MPDPLNIAIVSKAGLFPGAANLAAFWKNILTGQSAARKAPTGRWLIPADEVHQSGGGEDRTLSAKACFIEDFQFDPSRFNVNQATRDRLTQLDPMFHLLLHAGKEAWDSAKTINTDRSRTGIIIGNIALPTDASSALADEILGEALDEALRRTALSKTKTDPLNRYVAGLPAGVLAKVLGLTGSTFTLDAACASSLYAIKLACDELTRGRADAMLAGGLSRPDSLYTQMGFSQLKALSPTGRCAPFDAKADGLVVGEGCGMFVLKRLDDALRDGDEIHAVIRGIGLSNDIGGNLMLPDSEGQLRAMRAAYKQADWSPMDVDLIECHGTGTPTGDAVEVNSLAQLRGSHPSHNAVMGSVKSNVGHLLTGAGAAGMMKVLFAMREGVLPPTAAFERSAKNDVMRGAGLEVLAQPREWKRRGEKQPRRAAISAFGFGGINAHVLIEEFDANSPPAVRGQGGAGVGLRQQQNGTHQNTVRPTLPQPLPKREGSKSATPRAAVAIVGMDVRVGPWDSLDSFARRTILNEDHHEPQQPRHWWGHAKAADFKGYFIDEVTVPIGRFAIPPAELGDMLPQQLLMLQTAANAVAQAKLVGEGGRLERTGVFIGIGLDLNTTNFHFRWSMQDEARDTVHPPLTANRTMGALGGIVASRVARAFHVGGPSYTISAEEASGHQALSVAVKALQQNELDSAIVGAVDLAGDVRAAICERACGQSSREQMISDGAVAFVLKRHEDAVRDGDLIFAVIAGVEGMSEGFSADGATPRAAEEAEVARTFTDVDAETVGLVDSSERVSQLVGRCGAATGLIAVARAALCLHHDLLPADDVSARFWLRDRIDGPRRAVVSATSVDGNVSHVLLEEAHKAERSLFDRKPVSVIDATPQAAGSLAFVYPGAGNQYLGMGRALGLRWPQVLQAQDAENERLFSQFAHGRFWSASSLNEISHSDVIFGQVCLGTMVTDLFARFGVTPDAVIGYSLGETTSLFSTRWWPAESSRDEMLRRMESSTLFTTDLTGNCDAARKAWGLGANEKVDWLIGVIRCEREKVAAAVRGRKRVYLLLVNTPGECVIGGDRTAVMALARELRCAVHPVEGVTTVHCEVIEPVRERYHELHLHEVENPGGAKPRAAVYSSAWAKAYAVTREAAADSIMAQASAMVDFSRVIEAAYTDGVRIFVETGPGESCTRMIGEILGQREHHAMAICVQGEDEVENVVKTLLRLAELGVQVTDNEWEAEAQAVSGNVKETRPLVRVKVGREALDVSGIDKAASIHEEVREAISAQVTQQTHQSDEVHAMKQKEPREIAAVTMVAASHAGGVVDSSLAAQWSPMVEQLAGAQVAQAAAQEAFLRVAQSMTQSMARAIRFQGELLRGGTGEIGDGVEFGYHGDFVAPAGAKPRAAFDRDMCMEFAVGSIGRMLGPQFAPVDAHPTRVRLPDEPLMLCDRIMEVEGVPGSMTHGRCVTEHDIHPGSWYLDCGRIPTCIAVEAGQADLFLSGYLGIDFITKGLAVYRLLDAVVTFHGPLPHEGQIIRYDIRINEFFRQGDTYLFRFEFDATVNGLAVLTMRKGCAGFFTEAELAAGQGIVLTTFDKRVQDGVVTGGWKWLAPKRENGKAEKREIQGNSTAVSTPDTRHPTPESYSDAQINALRRGDARSLVDCFGDAFEGLAIAHPVGLPGGGDGPHGRMKLVHRVLRLDPSAGRFGLGQIVGEADIHPDDWFLTCHFSDDRVMPGTLMYECCLHTLRIYLLRMGWVGEAGEVVYEPIPEVPGQLKCRGQVNETTSKVQYEITIKEIGYGRRDDSTFSAGPKGPAHDNNIDHDTTPYVIADALMYADGRAVVQMNNMSLRLTGLTREKLETLWSVRIPLPPGEGLGEGRANLNASRESISSAHADATLPQPLPKREGSTNQLNPTPHTAHPTPRAPLFDYNSILAFSASNPSEAFGDRYKVFDKERKIARLPRPPFQFLDRIVSIENCEQWKLAAGGVIEAEYDVPPLGGEGAWYFASNRQNEMPFAVLLETALQPCGWLAAYLGSALTSDTDLRFRNLGGSATQFLPVTPDTGTLTTTIKITRVSQSGGMIIQNYDMTMRSAQGIVYRGDTYFGFFSADALRDQVGIRDAKLFVPDEAELTARAARTLRLEYPTAAPFSDAKFRMIDHIEHFDPQGGPHKLGFIQGTMNVNPAAWFFEAHFYEDPVVPGSLGLESFIQLLKFVAAEKAGVGCRVSGVGKTSDITSGSALSASSDTRNPTPETLAFSSPALGKKHTWIYRGQVVPKDSLVTVQAVVTEFDEVSRCIKADGFLSVDGRTIYQMKDFTLAWHQALSET